MEKFSIAVLEFFQCYVFGKMNEVYFEIVCREINSLRIQLYMIMV